MRGTLRMGDRKITFFSWRSPALDSQPIRLRTCEEVFVRSGAADLIAVSCRSKRRSVSWEPRVNVGCFSRPAIE